MSALSSVESDDETRRGLMCSYVTSHSGDGNVELMTDQ